MVKINKQFKANINNLYLRINTNDKRFKNGQEIHKKNNVKLLSFKNTIDTDEKKYKFIVESDNNKRSNTQYNVVARLKSSDIECTCTCPDHTYRKDNFKYCKHIIGSLLTITINKNEDNDNNNDNNNTLLS